MFTVASSPPMEPYSAMYTAFQDAMEGVGASYIAPVGEIGWKMIGGFVFCIFVIK